MKFDVDGSCSILNWYIYMYRISGRYKIQDSFRFLCGKEQFTRV